MAETTTQATNTATDATNNNSSVEQQNTPTVEELMAQLATVNAEKAKLKNAFDKTSSELATEKKARREMMSAEQQKKEADEEALAEHNKYVAELEAFQRKSLAKDRYLMQGMSAEMAIKAAEAEVSGDMDALVKIQQQNTEAIIKAKEAEWLASRPLVNAGGAETTMTKEQIMAIKDPVERQKAIRNNLALFN